MNTKNLKPTSLLIIIFLTSAFLRAEVILPAIFGDHMVLQQQTNAAIWGTASPGKTVVVTTSWDKKSYSTKSKSDGSWKLKVKTPVAGGPYDITISDGSILELKNVLIGEVWVCSGQSNMAMKMGGYLPVTNSNEAIIESTNGSIHLFTVERNTSLEPLKDFNGKWVECVPENVSNFSAAAYFFGQMVQKVLDVPVGLIHSSWGGTRIEPWISESGIKKFDFITLPDKNQQGKISPQTPTVLFNAMINPMVGYAIRGGLWYQGESNRNEPDQYVELMPGLVESWQKAWEIEDLQFFYAQIAPYDYGRGLNSAFLREAQLIASTAIPNIGMACLMDAGEQNNIHPANKKVVGERLAYLALAKTYGIGGFEYSGPVLNSMTIEGSMVNLTFDHAKNGLTTFGKDLVNFKIAGKNKRFYPAVASISRTGISLISLSVSDPVAVRYAFDDYVVGELYNTEGLPASSFRTDNWEE